MILAGEVLDLEFRDEDVLSFVLVERLELYFERI